MFLYLIGLLCCFLSTGYAEDPQYVDDSIIVSEKRMDYQVVQVYVDISEVIAPDGSTGTSNSLNILLAHYAHTPVIIQGSLQYWSNPEKWNGEVNIYNWKNIKYMPTFSECDYGGAIECGVKNKHWTLRTVVTVSDKYSTITMQMYDEKGRQISRGIKTAWGTIRWKPHWKLTKIEEKGPFGAASKKIFEMWPPEMEELPPLIRPFHVSQAMYGVMRVEQSACRTKHCNEIRSY